MCKTNIFSVNSGVFDTKLKILTPATLVVLVTNIRYELLTISTICVLIYLTTRAIEPLLGSLPLPTGLNGSLCHQQPIVSFLLSFPLGGVVDTGGEGFIHCKWLAIAALVEMLTTVSELTRVNTSEHT